jgi:hypothetical protein
MPAVDYSRLKRVLRCLRITLKEQLQPDPGIASLHRADAYMSFEFYSTILHDLSHQRQAHFIPERGRKER